MESQRKKVSLLFLFTGLYVFLVVSVGRIIYAWWSFHCLVLVTSICMFCYGTFFFAGHRSQLQVIVIIMYKQGKLGHLHVALTPY